MKVDVVNGANEKIVKTSKAHSFEDFIIITRRYTSMTTRDENFGALEND